MTLSTALGVPLVEGGSVSLHRRFERTISTSAAGGWDDGRGGERGTRSG